MCHKICCDLQNNGLGNFSSVFIVFLLEVILKNKKFVQNYNKIKVSCWDFEDVFKPLRDFFYCFY